MKLLVAIVLGVLASFGLTIVGEVLLFSSWMPRSVRHLYPEFPVVALAVGLLVGVIVRERAKIAAMWSLTPWAIWLIVASNRGPSTVKLRIITVAVVSLCFSVGIGAAALVDRRMAPASARDSHSPS